MMFHLHGKPNEDEDAPLSPCPHMAELVSGLSDGSLTGIKRWFTAQHIKGCERCNRTYTEFAAMRVRLHAIRETAEAAQPPQEIEQHRRAVVEAALDTLEKQTA